MDQLSLQPQHRDIIVSSQLKDVDPDFVDDTREQAPETATKSHQAKSIFRSESKKISSNNNNYKAAERQQNNIVNFKKAEGTLSDACHNGKNKSSTEFKQKDFRVNLRSKNRRPKDQSSSDDEGSYQQFPKSQYKPKRRGDQNAKDSRHQLILMQEPESRLIIRYERDENSVNISPDGKQRRARSIDSKILRLEQQVKELERKQGDGSRPRDAVSAYEVKRKKSFKITNHVIDLAVGSGKNSQVQAPSPQKTDVQKVKHKKQEPKEKREEQDPSLRTELMKLREIILSLKVQRQQYNESRKVEEQQHPASRKNLKSSTLKDEEEVESIEMAPSKSLMRSQVNDFAQNHSNKYVEAGPKTIYYTNGQSMKSNMVRGVPAVTGNGQPSASELNSQRDVMRSVRPNSKQTPANSNKQAGKNSRERLVNVIPIPIFNNKIEVVKKQLNKKLSHQDTSKRTTFHTLKPKSSMQGGKTEPVVLRLSHPSRSQIPVYNPQESNSNERATLSKFKGIEFSPKKILSRGQQRIPSYNQYPEQQQQNNDRVSFQSPEISRINALNHAQDNIIQQHDITSILDQANNKGEISNIEENPLRTSQDLKKNFIVFPKLPEDEFNALLNSEQLIELGRKVFGLFNIKIREDHALVIKKFRNCVYMNHQNRHILWHYNGKFYIGGWDAKGEAGQEGCKHGKGIQYIPGNYVYEGEFRSGKREGFGLMNSINGECYAGQWESGIRHGKGRLEQPNGVVYQGGWKYGKKEGFGRLIFSQTEYYEGTFEKGLKHGFGKEVYKNGDHYKGEYRNGKFEGEGTYKWSKGAFYHGQFVNGMRHGKGTWRSSPAGGDCYQGDYFQDRKSGYGKYTWQNGMVYEGAFVNDVKHGIGILKFTDGKVVEAIFEKGNMKKKITKEPQSNHNTQQPYRRVQVPHFLAPH